jgi:hypothetical protein
VRGEGSLVGVRDQDRERIRTHKIDCGGMVANAKMFRDVHESFSFACQGLVHHLLAVPTDYAVGGILSPLRGYPI